MPALPSVAKVIRVDLFQTFGANAAIRNRLFFQYSGALSVADLTTILTTIATAWGTNLLSGFSTQHTLTGLTGTDLTSATAAQATITTTKTGTDAGQPLAAGTAGVMKFKFARRYRGGHARFYRSGMTIAFISGTETLLGTVAANMVTQFNAFITACIAGPPAAVGTLQHVNVSYFSGFTNKTYPSGRVRPVPTLRGTPVVDAITNYTINPKIASQRRRNQQSP